MLKKLSLNISKMILSATAAIVLFSTVAYADITSCTYDRSTYMAEVSGTAQKNTQITIRVLKNGEIVFEDQSASDDTGKYNINFKVLGEPCTYDVLVGESNIKIPYSTKLDYYGSTDSAIGQINTASKNKSSADMKNAAVNNINVLFDKNESMYSVFSDTSRDLGYICEILASGNEYDTASFKIAAGEAVALDEIYNAASSDELKTVLDNNKTVLRLQDYSPYKTYTDLLSDGIRTTVFNEFSKNKVESADDFRSKFSELVLVQAASNANGWGDMKKVVEENKDFLGITLNTTANEITVYSNMLNANISSSAGIKTAYQSAVAAALQPQSGGSGGSGSGGSSSGSSSASGTGSIHQAPVKEYNSYSVLTDIDSVSWAKPHIEKLFKLGVINGYDDGTFLPNNNVKREEYVKMILTAFGLEKSGAKADFADVSQNAWYYEYVAAAVEAGIIQGIGDNKFGAGQDITRQDMAVIACRAAKLAGKDLSKGQNITEFADKSGIADYALESVEILTKNGIVNGIDGSFMPYSYATRAQVAVIISSLYDVN
ncbi:MAG: S-layer homology domain-containing protein [Clostridiales bacterium]|nr:S-layer homology domain-containing protein [Clostridiales bacterium]